MAVKNRPEISLRYAQGEVFNCDKRFRVLVAGRRFGKSYLSCIELLRGAINRPGEVYFYCAPTYRMAKDIAWKELKRLVPKVCCLLYTSPSPRDLAVSRMPSSA